VSATGPGPFTLHQVTDRHRLETLGRKMSNCLATFDRRLRGRHRIVEVRQDGETRYAVYLHDGRIDMFEAAHNRRPDPADVPVVRALLEQEGHLAATLAPSKSGRRYASVPPAGDGQMILPVPVGGARTGARGARAGGRANGANGGGAGPARPARPRPQPQPRPPAEPPGISVQGLATALLDPAADDTPSWQELAAALWATGVLPQLPDPAASTYACVVRDLARRIAVGDTAALPRRVPPTAAARQAARRDLLAHLDHVTEVSWQRRRMANVLAADLRP
jgi:hypothetical protein